MERQRNIKYVIYKEGNYFVAQCLNVEVSSFGETIDEAIKNIHEAVELYFEDSEENIDYLAVDEALIGDYILNGQTVLFQTYN